MIAVRLWAAYSLHWVFTGLWEIDDSIEDFNNQGVVIIFR